MAVGIETREMQAAAAADAFAAGKFLVTERLCRTRAGDLVTEERCTDGGNLAYIPGMEIPLAEARAAGLVPEIEVTTFAQAPEVTPPVIVADATPAPAPSPRGKGK